MDLKPYLAFLIQILTAFAAKTATTLDDTALGLLKALQDSPLLLDWIGSLLKTQATMPSGALAELSPDDPALIAAYNASPAVREWAMTVKPENVPAGAEPLAIGTVLTLLKYLPALWSLFKA